MLFRKLFPRTAALISIRPLPYDDNDDLHAIYIISKYTLIKIQSHDISIIILNYRIY